MDLLDFPVQFGHRGVLQVPCFADHGLESDSVDMREAVRGNCGDADRRVLVTRVDVTVDFKGSPRERVLLGEVRVRVVEEERKERTNVSRGRISDADGVAKVDELGVVSFI